MKKVEIVAYFSNVKDSNVAFHVGWDTNEAQSNQEKILAKIALENKKIIHMNQVHKDNIVVVDELTTSPIAQCDGIISTSKNIALMVMVADCIPILIWDKKQGVIGAVHSGRNGTFLKIAQKTIQKMIALFGCDPANIEVLMGPAIQKCCYEVDDAMAQIARANFGEAFVNGRYLDLVGMCIDQIIKIGVPLANIQVSQICTCCQEEQEYFSFRRDKNSGRFCGIISLIDAKD